MTRGSLVFEVRGLPQPQGSKRIGRNRKTGQPILINDNDAKLRVWRTAVRDAAQAEREHSGLTFTEPVEVEVRFALRRPKRPKFGWPGVKPDADKLLRAVLDGLVDGGLLADDALATDLVARKRYAAPGREGAVIGVRSVACDG